MALSLSGSVKTCRSRGPVGIAWPIVPLLLLLLPLPLLGVLSNRTSSRFGLLVHLCLREPVVLLLLRRLRLQLSRGLVRCRLHDLLLGLALYFWPIGVLHLRVRYLWCTLRDVIRLHAFLVLLEEQVAASMTLSILSLPLEHSLLPLSMILIVHVLRALPEMILPSVLILYVLVIDLVLSTQICEIVVVDVVVEDMRATLLVLVDVVVQVVLGGRDEVSGHGRIVLIVVDVVLDLGVRDRNGGLEATSPLTTTITSLSCASTFLPHIGNIFWAIPGLPRTLHLLGAPGGILLSNSRIIGHHLQQALLLEPLQHEALH